MDDKIINTVNNDDLTRHVRLIKQWIDQYDSFLTRYTGDVDGKHIMINKTGLTSNSFHYETGRGGYFSTNSGTSEGQELTLRGSLLAYQATGKRTWLDRANKLTEALLSILYQNRPIPDEPDVTWVPHWLFNAKSDFRSQEYFTDLKVSFVNGKATITKENIFKVFSVRANNANLVWNSPFSAIDGTSYTIDQVEYPDENTAVVELSENISAELLVVFGTNTGPMIYKDEVYDAYPIWRKLEENETVCAIDSLAWGLDCFKLLLEITGQAKWQKAIDSTSESIRAAFHIDNSIVYITPPKLFGNIFENGMYHYTSRENAEIYTQNKRTGFIDIHYPEITSFGDGQIGKGSVNALFGANNWIEAKIGSKNNMVVNLLLDEESVYDADKRWTAPLHLDGSGKMQTFKLFKEDFFKTSNIFWGPNYKNADGTLINDSQSQVNADVIIENNNVVQHVNFQKSDSGWAQFLFGMWPLPTFPFGFKYRTNDDIDFVIRDANDTPWRCRLPKTDKYKLINLTASMFVSDNGLSNFPDGSFSSLLVDTISSKSDIYVDYIGTLDTLPENTKYSTVTLSYSGLAEADMFIESVVPMPSNPLKYVPYVAPFDYHLSDGNVNTWRGPAYSGYQTPYIWQELAPFVDEFGNNNDHALSVNLQFMKDSQEAYYKRNNIYGGFAPSYFWDRWDSIQYQSPDTWGWLPAPDPNVDWGGFQYRAVDSVARVCRNNSENSMAKQICMDFFKMIDLYWTENFNMPTVFGDSEAPKNTYDDTHMAALLLRALVNIYLADYVEDDRKLLLKLVNKTLNYLDKFHVSISSEPFSQYNIEGTFSTEPDNGQWYGFWGGEILDALAEIVINTRTHATLYLGGALGNDEQEQKLVLYNQKLLIEGLATLDDEELRIFRNVDVQSDNKSAIQYMSHDGVKSLEKEE
ncbi:hypothetical protein EFM34_05875 [Leuconostoc suionicum]|uniref:hypothetical protein n=1 Tax=Leuconostoc suionicum TaxID=1511761 RepID=UPI0021AA9DAA|nr:hypothetical protein [Leuconostoc suionicum]MCT4382759.1 hypothetical protein [Leuconostoc suionicum]